MTVFFVSPCISTLLLDQCAENENSTRHKKIQWNEFEAVLK